MKTPTTLRTVMIAFLSILSLLVLAACDDRVYVQTGKELSLSKSASPLTVQHAGMVISYTYVVTNNTNPQVDVGLSGITIALADSPLDGPVVCPFTMLKQGETMTCHATYTVTDQDIANGGVTNKATATGDFTSQDCLYSTSKDYYKCDLTNAKHTVTASASAVVTVYGTAPTDTETPTPTATEPPPSATPTQSLPPILLGDVSYCDPLLHLMNMPFVNGFSPLNYKHDVTMNGLPVNCQVNGSNSKLLTCSYPASLVFPATIQVSINGIVVNQFTFNGASCVVPPQPTKKPAPSAGCTPLPGYVCP
jgi:hypothetical protein